jgi:ribosomal protein S27E
VTPRCACGQPAPHATICRDCTTELASTLLEIPGDDGLACHLGITFARLSRLTAAGPHRGHVSLLPYETRAAEATAHLRGVLVAWVRDLNETLQHRWPADTLPSMAVWLHAHLACIRQHQAAGDMLGEVRDAVERGWQVTDKPRQRVYTGPCPGCGTDLLTWPGHTRVTCTGCGTTYDIAERQEHMRTQLDDYLGTAAYASAILPGIGVHVTAAMIRGWAHRHVLEVRVVVPARGPSGIEQPLYRLGDIITLALAREAAKAQ